MWEFLRLSGASESTLRLSTLVQGAITGMIAGLAACGILYGLGRGLRLAVLSQCCVAPRFLRHWVARRCRLGNDCRNLFHAKNVILAVNCECNKGAEIRALRYDESDNRSSVVAFMMFHRSLSLVIIASLRFRQSGSDPE